MYEKRIIAILFSVLLAVVLVTSSAAARPLADALGTGFTYQGRLTNGGFPANGTYDFQFSLYNALSGGTPVGSTLTVTSLTVTNGLFTVQLDFGNVFDGTALYLQMAVRPGGGGSYTPLIPRQPLTATPYALYSKQAGNSALLGGYQTGNASGNVPLSNGTLNTNLNADLLDGLQASAFTQAPKNIIVVAKSGGNYTSITAALNSLSDASDTNRYLIYVAPGVYNEQVTMKPYVDIEGAGELTTKITWTGSSLNATGTVVGASNAELRFLTVENTGGNTYAIAIDSGSAAPRLTHVTASSSGATGIAIGVYNTSSTSTVMTNVTATASGSAAVTNYGVLNFSSSPTMTNVTASASGGTNAEGIGNANSSPTMTGVTTSASGATNNYGMRNTAGSSPGMTGVTASASGGANAFGVYNASGSSPVMTGVGASATGATNNYGIWNDNSSPTIQNSAISASGGSVNDGIHNVNSSGPITIKISNSEIMGSNNTIYSDSSNYTVQLGSSQLIGGGAQGAGAYLCVFSYDGNFIALSSTCH